MLLEADRNLITQAVQEALESRQRQITEAVQNGVLRALAVWTLIGAVIWLIGYVIARS